MSFFNVGRVPPLGENSSLTERTLKLDAAVTLVHMLHSFDYLCIITRHTEIDNYGNDGGLGVVRLACRFYRDRL